MDQVPVPILSVGAVLLATIQTDLDDSVVTAFQDRIATRIAETRPVGVVIDISALDIVDSFIGRTISTVASISHLLGSSTVVVGMRPAVAITMTELGLSLGGARTALALDRALAMAGGSGADTSSHRR